jgi:nitroimidazol reductase NimA-like FMN-containing flavoprotein (pyridoxamine 5'-phosphate oxidase superfamily)
MLTWGRFARQRPDLAEIGRGLLYQYGGIGIGFLATVTRQGLPRLHPICPAIAGETLYAFLVPSPKLNDLLRDGHYALHSDLTPHNEDAFYLTGRIRPIADAAERAALARAYAAERANFDPSHLDSQTAIEFLIDTCLLTRTTGHGDVNPQHTVWHAP